MVLSSIVPSELTSARAVRLYEWMGVLQCVHKIARYHDASSSICAARQSKFNFMFAQVNRILASAVKSHTESYDYLAR